MKLTIMFFAAWAALASLLAAPADAQVRFTIAGGYSATFVLPTAPTPPSEFVVDGYSFSLTDVSGRFGGTSGTADLTFFNGGVGGGLLVSRGFDYLFDAGGAQLYSGTEGAPVFFARTQPFSLNGLSTPGTFVVTVAAVPEPAGWAMMIVGFALVGGTLRRRMRSSGNRLPGLNRRPDTIDPVASLDATAIGRG